jgi:chemotaxis signal transduction protein
MVMAMKALCFSAGGEWFAADIATVGKVARNLGLTPLPAAPEGVAGIAGIKGKVVTLLDLAALRGARKAGSQARAGSRVDAVVFKGTAASPDEMGLIIESTGDIIDIDPGRLARPRQDRETDLVAGHYGSGGTLYSIIDINLITGRFKDAGRRNAAERQRGAGNE